MHVTVGVVAVLGAPVERVGDGGDPVTGRISGDGGGLGAAGAVGGGVRGAEPGTVEGDPANVAARVGDVGIARGVSELVDAAVGVGLGLDPAAAVVGVVDVDGAAGVLDRLEPAGLVRVGGDALVGVGDSFQAPVAVVGIGGRLAEDVLGLGDAVRRVVRQLDPLAVGLVFNLPGSSM